MASARHDDRGQITVVVLGFTAMLVLVVVMVVDASAAYLQRQSLASIADGAALAAADGMKAEQVYRGGAVDDDRINLAVARGYVESYLRSTRARRAHPGIRVVLSRSDGSLVARVSAPLDVPLMIPGVRRPRVAAESAAFVVVAP